MRVRCIPAKALAVDLVQKWTILQRGNRLLSSPFFCPEYTSAIAGARDDVFIGILEEDNEVVGLFPFQRVKRVAGLPIGWPMCDYQGLIAGPETDWNPEELLRGCRLVAWDFDHLIVSQPAFRPFIRQRRQSWILNLATGYESYAQGKIQSGSRLVERIDRQVRRLQRNVGPVRFEPRVADHAVLDQMLVWWAEKWTKGERVGRWTSAVLHKVLETRTDGFAGMLSALYAGDELLALDFGMRTQSVWHSWFPAYNRQFARYSPGAVLLMKIAEAAPSFGIKVLDLGPGESPYKLRLANDSIVIAEGSVAAFPLVAGARVAIRALRAVRRRLMFG
ncbi:MAG TPA: GNAT family N-acetyltransferase [Verrucomicrobiae bacterium]|nr:GNAT family N-acetyltransferase [Verrucomicrobiae bacterium]